MASRRRRRGSHPLSVRFAASIVLSGPPDEEGIQRSLLAAKISSFLRAGCARFGRTRQPEIWARRIAESASYRARKTRRAEVLSLHVEYRNRTLTSAGTWKRWVYVEGGKDGWKGTAGEPTGKRKAVKKGAKEK